MTDELREINRLVALIEPILAGKPPVTQGAALADLLAIWLAGHHVEGDSTATSELRHQLLREHMLSVASLISVNAQIMGTTP